MSLVFLAVKKQTDKKNKDQVIVELEFQSWVHFQQKLVKVAIKILYKMKGEISHLDLVKQLVCFNMTVLLQILISEDFKN